MSIKPWSFSTTIRNPERIVGFLRILAQFEGYTYNDDFKMRYEKQLIANLLYKPNTRTIDITNKYIEGTKLTDEEVEWLMNNNPQQIGWLRRSETHLQMLQELGLFYIDASNKLFISETGKQLINEVAPISSIFLKILMKWQYPTFFRRSNKMKIIPFIATLQIIRSLNEQCKTLNIQKTGLSKLELGLFVSTISDYHDINKAINTIINFRKKKYTQQELKTLIINTIKQFFGKYTPQKEHTLIKDYPDNIFRYFSLTDLFIFKEGAQRIDLSVLKRMEIDNILANFSPEPLIFKNIAEEIGYKIDPSKPRLPWEKDLQEAKRLYINALNNFKKITNFNLEKKVFTTPAQYSNEVEKINNEIKLWKLTQKKVDYFNQIPEYLKELENINSPESKYANIEPALRLEYLVANILIGLNLTIKIKPNYLADENGWPIYFAPGGTADIECYYDNFNVLYEVTLIKSRDQQYKNETQPIMRHLRDFEIKHPIDTICIFIAPVIHRDTINAFWFSVKGGYEGKPQKLIPLTIKQFITLVNKFYNLAKSGELNPNIIKTELEKLVNIKDVHSSLEWEAMIQKLLFSSQYLSFHK